MRHYLRTHSPGATCFFTVNLAERRKNRLLTDHIDALRAAFRRTRQDHPFDIDAIVVLPAHLHVVWTLPEHDADFSMRWSLIKARFSKALERVEVPSASRIRRRERGIWHRRFWEHRIRDEADLAAHVDYIHWNPVRHRLVERVADWPYSSFHRFVWLGRLAPDWAAPPRVIRTDRE